MTSTPDFKIKLPLPPSLNAAFRGTGIRGNYALQKTENYTNWIELAGTFFRQQYPLGIPPEKMLTGRIRAQYVVYRNTNQSCDIGNYEKIVADWLEGKFFINDSQIDEVHITRRIDQTAKRNFLFVFLTEIEDRRKVDMFNLA